MKTKEKAELREAVKKEFPYTWLDPLLTGKDVPELPWNCPEIEWYTRQLKERVLKAIDHMEGNCSGCENHFKDSKDCPICKVYEHPQPLDAGEADERKEKDFINDRYGISDEDHQTALEPGHIYDLMTAFAQASITAKEKEWEREKAELTESQQYWIKEYARLSGVKSVYDFWIRELLKALDSGDNRPVEAAVRELQELMEKHTNE